MSATIKDIAKKLKLSISTVSYALNDGPKPVSKVVYRRVHEVARELGYRPNRLARSLVTRRTHTIGVVPAAVQRDILLTPCIHLTLNGIFNAAEELKQDVVIFTAHDRNLPNEVAHDLLDGRVDGVVFVAPRLDSPALHEIADSGLPYAIVTEDDGKGPSFIVDNELGTLMALEHLFALGHRRIAHLVGEQLLPDAMVRRDTYREFMRSRDLAIEEQFEMPGDYNRASGFEAGQMIAAMSNPPTAVFCANDDSALGMLDSLKSQNIAVPGQISIVGFDDAPLAQYVPPGLTTVRQPLEAMARQALLAIVHQIETGTPCAGEVFRPELIIRGSTAPANLESS